MLHKSVFRTCLPKQLSRRLIRANFIDQHCWMCIHYIQSSAPPPPGRPATLTCQKRHPGGAAIHTDISPQNPKHTGCAKHSLLFTHSLAAWSCACAPFRAIPSATDTSPPAGGRRPPALSIPVHGVLPLRAVRRPHDFGGVHLQRARRWALACSWQVAQPSQRMHARSGPEVASV